MRTTPHDPADWPTPPRTVLHAGAHMYGTSQLRRQAHKALRLFVTAGTWAAGLCLVIGALVLVASAAGHAGHAATEAATRNTARHADQRERQLGQPGGSQAIATFAGHGNQTTRQLPASTARWHVQWSYRCAAGTTNGMLVVGAAGAATEGAGVDVTGTSGHGSAWFGPVAGHSHRLIVISTCNWRLTAIQHR
jgi:hypothetical protein